MEGKTSIYYREPEKSACNQKKETIRKVGEPKVEETEMGGSICKINNKKKIDKKKWKNRGCGARN